MHKWLRERKISEQVEKEFNLSFDNHITIPVYDSSGQFSFNKYRRSPDKNTGMKYWYDKGASVELYGWHKAKEHKTILITEGEVDCLVAWSHNIPAVTSTGGAMSFQEEWGELLKDKEVILCFDNDHAGAEGMVKVLNYVPHAKVLIIPDESDMKDVSDYVMRGGDLHKFIQTAQHFDSIEEVKEDQGNRIAVFKCHTFHDSYIKKHTRVAPKNVKRVDFSNDKVVNAKNYPITNLIAFNSNKKALCPYHQEKTPSLTYFKNDNTVFCFGCSKKADSIDLYQKLNGGDYKNAVNKLQ